MFSSAIGRFNEKRRVSERERRRRRLHPHRADGRVLILAILLAIAIPTFLGVTKSANDRAVQSNINTAITNAKGPVPAVRTVVHQLERGWLEHRLVRGVSGGRRAVAEVRGRLDDRSDG